MALIPSSLSPEEVAQLNQRFATASPQEVLSGALERFPPRIALASSFGAEDVVLIDMLWRLHPQARVFTLDTLRLNTETYEVMDRIREKYGIHLEVYYPNLEKVAEMVAQHGFNLFYTAPELRKLCCGIRKVEPLEQALQGLDAWISGLRREQAPTRTAIAKLELDGAHPGKIKINPLADWTGQQVWDYIRTYEVPYNELHDRGYPSIGCAPCTRAIKPGEDPRAGRWWWEEDLKAKECGIHVKGAPKDLKGVGISPAVSGKPQASPKSEGEQA